MATWFFSGTFMKDGTPITIEARSESELNECVSKGLVPVEKQSRKKSSVGAKIPARSRKK
ncbi:MAG: hypothetical protein ACE5DW_00690 [Thermodesulfobacteriota bacterium]